MSRGKGSIKREPPVYTLKHYFETCVLEGESKNELLGYKSSKTIEVYPRVSREAFVESEVF